jgi:glycosyltransferase involved in cell wall biosynthesis
MEGAGLSVGFVSPFPPTRSGIADYSAELLPALSKEVDVTAYEPARVGRALAAGHDVLLFQIGNDPLHAPSVEALADPGRKTPAVVVLHDFSLHHIFAAAYLDGGRRELYVRALERAHGPRGRELGERNAGGSVLPVWDLDPWNWPASGGVIRDAAALIAHSRLVRGAILREHPAVHVVEVPHHVVPAPRTPSAEACRALGLPEDRPIAISLGVVTPAKRVGKILEALAAIPKPGRPFLFVGGAVGKDDALHDVVSERGIEGDVAFGGYLSEEDFWRAASAATMAVNLRYPTMGETSGAVCRLAGFGLPILVSDTGWFRELPDTFAAKIPIGNGEIERLAGEMERLASDPAEAARRSEAAAAWGRARHPDRVAASYADVLRDTAAGWSRARTVPALMAHHLTRLGLGQRGELGSPAREPDALVAAAVATRSAGLLPPALPDRWRGV